MSAGDWIQVGLCAVVFVLWVAWIVNGMMGGD